MTPAIEDIANHLVEEMLGRDVDVVTALTTPLPVIVISRLMGIPEARRDDFKRWSDALTGTLAGALPTERRAEVMEMAAFFQSLIGERRAHPGEDLVSAIVNAEIDGERLSDNDIVGFNILLLIAGNETTTNLLGNLLNVLADRPDLWSALRNDPALIEVAIEETLRFDSPVQFLVREATEDVDFHGQRVRKGERVAVVMGSANRDPDLHTDPDTFRLDRERARHYAFGYGIHFCIGAPLARLEARMSMAALVRRASTLVRGEGHAERVPSHLLRGFHRLPVMAHKGSDLV
jgi:cytochrome P450